MQASKSSPRTLTVLFVVTAAAFLAIMAYFVRLGFGTSGSVFGAGAAAVSHSAAAPAQMGPVNVQGGGPPAAVQVQLAQMRLRIAKNPRDDVALTQLGDTYLVVGKFADAIPLYRRALKVNPSNAAAREGLQQARDGLAKGTP